MRHTKYIPGYLLVVLWVGADSAFAQEELRIFDGKPKTLVVNGYSTSYHWPRMLERKLDRYLGRDRVVRVGRALRGGTPIAKWIDVKTGRPLPPWEERVRPALARQDGRPVIVLAQQSLQWVFGERRVGIRNDQDDKHIRQGADAMQKYVELLQKDGADLVILAVHIYKHPMEPEIGNERYALDELMRRKIPGVERGPDVWTPTKKLHPQAFARDGVHPNSVGAEVMAQMWFRTLLKREGLDVPAWSREEMEGAIRRGPVPLRRGKRRQPAAQAESLP